MAVDRRRFGTVLLWLELHDARAVAAIGVLALAGAALGLGAM